MKWEMVGRASWKYDSEDLVLHLDQMAGGVAVVGKLDAVAHGRGVHLLELGGDPEGGDAEELEVELGNGLGVDVAVDDADSETEGVGAQAELLVDLHQPVNEDHAHLASQLGLVHSDGSAAVQCLH